MASDSDMDVEDYYIVEDDNESASSEYVPCVNYPNDKVYPEDEKNCWVRLDEDTGPLNIYRFKGSCWNYMNLNKYTPGAVFDEFFEDRMWTILSENTNHAKLRQAKDKGGKDPIELLSEGVYQIPSAWLNNWEDTSLDEMKVFVAHLIVIGILKKNSLKQYWSRDSILNMPYFGHYMSRNCFQNILWNLHVSDPDETNPQKGEANHDPLFLVRPMVDMMQRNFHTKYRPGKELSLDESTCPFKGRVHFKCYNPKKPNRFHIKLFMVSEPSTGYICGFEVYTGDASGQSQGNAQELQDASKTSCTVLGLLDSVQLLDMGHHVYFDNYYNSPDLIDLLYKPKKYTSYWCSICKHALCIDPCFRLYHTEKDYTSEIIKIARMSVKPIQKDAQHVQKDAQHVQKMFNMSKEATQLKWDNLTAWAYSIYTQVPESSIQIYHI